MPDPFEAFDRVVDEEKPLVKTIKGERFEFPGACPSEIALDFLGTVLEKPDADLNMLAVYEFSQMMGDEEVKRLTKVTSFKALQVLVVGLFQHYGLLTKEEEATPPNRQARRASSKASSKGSARSGRGSAATTRSTSRQTSRA